MAEKSWRGPLCKAIILVATPGKPVALSSVKSCLHHRNAFDDDREKENEIEILTKQITRGFHKCQNAIKLIGQRARNSSTQQQRMAANIMSSLASTLQVFYGFSLSSSIIVITAVLHVSSLSKSYRSPLLSIRFYQ